MKACVDCKFFVPSKEWRRFGFVTADAIRFGRCAHLAAVMTSARAAMAVTGKPVSFERSAQHAEDMRRDWPDTNCGLNGKFWQPKAV